MNTSQSVPSVDLSLTCVMRADARAAVWAHEGNERPLSVVKRMFV